MYNKLEGTAKLIYVKKFERVLEVSILIVYVAVYIALDVDIQNNMI